jgi:hypothetical protein
MGSEAGVDDVMIAEAYPELGFDECTREALAAIAARHGVDFATALFYDRIRRAPQNRELIEAIERADEPIAAPPRVRGRVLIAPALFYRERPDIGGDGMAIQLAARAAGLEVEVLPVDSAGTAHENGIRLRTLLAERCTDRTVLVSLSKGAADVRVALESMPPPPGLRAWVIVSGLLHGTPAIDHLMRRWWRRLGLRLLLARYRAPFELVHEFSARGPSPLNRPAFAPDGLLVINLFGCPLSDHLGTRFGRRRHRELAPHGPNDGLTLLRDAIVEPGLAYPLWGADHYFRTAEVPRVLSRLIAFLVDRQCFLVEPSV